MRYAAQLLAVVAAATYVSAQASLYGQVKRTVSGDLHSNVTNDLLNSAVEHLGRMNYDASRGLPTDAHRQDWANDLRVRCLHLLEPLLLTGCVRSMVRRSNLLKMRLVSARYRDVVLGIFHHFQQDL
jgi:hypothetical protein